MPDRKLSRREALTTAALTGAGATAGYVLTSTPSLAASRVRTPSQTEGPFYPINDQVDKDADMTVVQGRTETAVGPRVSMAGRVVDGVTGEPIEGAIVEFWQACASGKYDHPDDPNPAELDPNFQYWAQVRSDAMGHFDILTIIPGAYPATPSWTRPPHIHVKVHKVGYPSLTTQVYFEGNRLNEIDQILQGLSPAEQKLVTVKVEEEHLTKRWDIFIVPRGRSAGARRAYFTVTPTLE